MKNALIIAGLFVLLISPCFAQTGEARVKEMLADNLGSFIATGAASMETDSEGILAGKREYKSGDKALELVIAIVDTEAKIEMMNGYVQDLIDMGERFGLEMQVVEGENQFGIITHNSKSESKLGGVFMRVEDNLIRAEITNTEGLGISRDLLQTLGFPIDESETASSKAKVDSPQKTTEKPTGAEAKMLRMLTDSYGSFKAAGSAKTGTNEKGVKQMSRNYESGNKIFKLKITALGTSDESQKARDKVKKKINSIEANEEKKVIQNDNKSGVFYFEKQENTGRIYVIFQNNYLIVGTLTNAVDLEEVKNVYRAMDFSVLK